MPFDKFGMLIKEKKEEPESDEELESDEVERYAFAVNDGEHYDISETFDTYDEAMKFWEKEEKAAMEDPEKYFGEILPLSDWTEEFYPHIELRKIDEEGDYVDDVESFHPIDYVDLED